MTFGGNIVLYHCCLHNHQIKACATANWHIDDLFMMALFSYWTEPSPGPPGAVQTPHDPAWFPGPKPGISGALFLFVLPLGLCSPASPPVRYSSQTVSSVIHKTLWKKLRSTWDRNQAPVSGVKCPWISLNCNVSISRTIKPPGQHGDLNKLQEHFIKSCIGLGSYWWQCTGLRLWRISATQRMSGKEEKILPVHPNSSARRVKVQDSPPTPPQLLVLEWRPAGERHPEDTRHPPTKGQQHWDTTIWESGGWSAAQRT